MSRIRFPARPLAAALGACLLCACSATPPEWVNADGQRVQRVCEEEQSASGSRVNSRVCRDVVVGQADEAESSAAQQDPQRD